MTPCWIDKSKKPRKSDGYVVSKARDEYRDRTAHSISYEILRGELRPGMHLHHKCHTPACYNPKHLEWLTASEHMKEHSPNQYRDRTHCKNGHEFIEPNFYWSEYKPAKWRRVCRKCESDRNR